MKALVYWLLGSILVLSVDVEAARAQFYPPCRPQAPDTSGPGFYTANRLGAVYGPHYWLRPPWPPYSGIPPFAPGFGGNGGGLQDSPLFPTHPYARSPRDFFMYYERETYPFIAVYPPLSAIPAAPMVPAPADLIPPPLVPAPPPERVPPL